MAKKDKKSRKNKQKSREDQAHNLFMFLSFLFVFITGIQALGTLKYFYGFFTQDFQFDQAFGILTILIFLGYAIGIYGIFKPRPPLHVAAIIASIVNVIVSLIIIILGSSQGLIIGVLAFLHAYLGIRFPLDFSESSATFKV